VGVQVDEAGGDVADSAEVARGIEPLAAADQQVELVVGGHGRALVAEDAANPGDVAIIP